MADSQIPMPTMIFLPARVSDSESAPMLQLWHALSGGQKPAQKPVDPSSTYQVVAVYPSGTRHPVREPWPTYGWADLHKRRCQATAYPEDTWTYEIDRYYTGSDGQRHWRGNV